MTDEGSKDAYGISSPRNEPSNMVKERHREKPVVLRQSDSLYWSNDEKVSPMFDLSNPDLSFTYYPKIGLTVEERSTPEGHPLKATLEGDALIALVLTDPDLGYVYLPVKTFFEDTPTEYTRDEYWDKVKTTTDLIKEKYWKVMDLAETTGADIDYETQIQYINELREINPFFTPEELFEYFAKKIDVTSGKPVTKALMATGVLDSDPEKSKYGIVAYFNLYNQLKGEEQTNPKKAKDALQQFPYLHELLDEFKRKPDGRFSDTLLVTCSQMAKEHKTEK